MQLLQDAALGHEADRECVKAFVVLSALQELCMNKITLSSIPEILTLATLLVKMANNPIS